MMFRSFSPAIQTMDNLIGQTSRMARITLNERRLKSRKERFGLELYEVMERNRNLGEKTGGETMPEVVGLFHDYYTGIRKLLKARKRKQDTLARTCLPRSLGGKYVNLDPFGCPEKRVKEKESLSPLTSIKKAYKSIDRSQAKVRLKSEIASIDREIHRRKETFGIDMYDTMMNIPNFLARDDKVQAVFERAKNDILEITLDITKTEKEMNDVRTNGDIVVSHDEVKALVNKNPSMWAMLSVNLGFSEEECKDVAFRVAIELISGKNGKKAAEALLTNRRFERFQRKYMRDPKGAQEFFHRSVFLAFDADWNGQLDSEETDKFLDTFYVTGSIFQGDARLPEKQELKELILERLDHNRDGQFSFSEIRSLISGNASVL